MVKYIYDAWGNCTIKNGNGTDENIPAIGGLNPIRYRSYYYDTETGLYYLQTRYYDPNAGRFISMDDTAYLDPETINGLNLYVYCGDNPVMRVDPDGTKWWEFWKWDWKAIATVALSAIAIVGGIALTIATAGAASPILGLAGAIVSGALIGFGTGLGQNLISQGMTVGFNNIDYGKAFAAGGIGAAIGAISGLVSFAGASILSSLGSSLGFTLSKMVIGGLKVAKVFSTKTLMITGSIIGKILGGLGGAVAGDMMGNKLFENRYDFDKNFGDTFGSTLIGWLGDIWSWIRKVV